jgi:hypothetical protein
MPGLPRALLLDALPAAGSKPRRRSAAPRRRRVRADGRRADQAAACGRHAGAGLHRQRPGRSAAPLRASASTASSPTRSTASHRRSAGL